MLAPDLINAVFEGLGGFVILLNVRRILKDKLVRGADWKVMAFFWLWGIWNLYYYPSLDQMLSFYAGIGIVVANAWYLYLMIYYIKREKHTLLWQTRMMIGARVEEVRTEGCMATEKSVRRGRVRWTSKMRVYDGGHGKDPDRDGYSEYPSVCIVWEDGKTEEQPQGGYFYNTERGCWSRAL